MTLDEQIGALPPHNREDRRQRACAALEAAGLDRLLAASNGLHRIDASNPVFHLTGFRSVGPCFIVMERDGSLRALGGPHDDSERIARAFCGEGAARDDLEHALAPFVASASGRVGVVGLGAAPYRLAAIILEALGDGVVAFDAEFDRATGVKTSQEIAQAVAATRIAEAGWRRLRELARPGARECDLAVAVDLFMKEMGADDSFLMLNAAPRADAVMPSSERALERGDLLLCELSPCVGGQFVQICRTLVLGEPTGEAREAYGFLASAMRDGIAQARPDAAVGAVCRAIDDHLSAAGYESFSRPPFIRRRGHGLGAGSVFPGDVAADNPARLEPGTLFVVHPNQFLPQTGYMMCGEPVVVGPCGPIVLSAEMAQLAGPAS